MIMTLETGPQSSEYPTAGETNLRDKRKKQVKIQSHSDCLLRLIWSCS